MGGKRLKSFKGHKIRPTSDKVKEALFNILGGAIFEDALVLDIFAGTGNLGIEALSRGAREVTFIEKDRSSIRLLRENVDICGISDETGIVPLDAKKGVALLGKKRQKFDIIFLDPPYGKGLAHETLEMLGESGISKGAVVIAEHSPEESLEARYGELHLTDSRRYGDTSLSFFGEENN